MRDFSTSISHFMYNLISCLAASLSNNAARRKRIIQENLKMHLQTIANFVVQYTIVENCDNSEQFRGYREPRITHTFFPFIYLNIQYSTAYNARENFRNNIGTATRDVKLLSI